MNIRFSETFVVKISDDININDNIINNNDINNSIQNKDEINDYDFKVEDIIFYYKCKTIRLNPVCQ